MKRPDSSSPAPYPLAITNLLRESLALGQMPRLTVTSRSMAPLLLPGDQVGLTAVSPADLRPGDIITVTTQTGFLTHRYWGSQTKKGQLYLFTRGDRVWQWDPPCPVENLLGKATVRVRHERPFSLTTGSGDWLNRHLTWLAGIEYQMITGKRLEIGDWRLTLAKLTSFGRFVRRLFWLWATGIVNFIGIILPYETGYYTHSKTTG